MGASSALRPARRRAGCPFYGGHGGHHRGDFLCAGGGSALQGGHEHGVLPGVPWQPWPADVFSGRAGAVSLYAQVVPWPGLCEPAVPLYGGGLSVLSPLLHPRLPQTLAHGAGGGVRLSELPGLSPEHCVRCGALPGHDDSGPPQGRTETSGPAPGRRAVCAGLRGLRGGLFGLGAARHGGWNAPGAGQPHPQRSPVWLFHR